MPRHAKAVEMVRETNNGVLARVATLEERVAFVLAKLDSYLECDASLCADLSEGMVFVAAPPCLSKGVSLVSVDCDVASHNSVRPYIPAAEVYKVDESDPLRFEVPRSPISSRIRNLDE